MFRRQPVGRHRRTHPDRKDALPRLMSMMEEPTQVIIPQQRQPYDPGPMLLPDSMALEDDRGWAP